MKTENKVFCTYKISTQENHRGKIRVANTVISLTSLQLS